MNKQDKLIVFVLFIALGLWLWHGSRSGAKRRPQPDKQGQEQVDRQPDDKQPEDTAKPDDKQPEDTAKPDDKQPEDTAKPDDKQPEDTAKPDDKQPEDTAKPDDTEPAVPAEGFADLEPAKPVALTVDGRSVITIDPEKGGIVKVEMLRHKLEKKAAGNMVLGHEDFPMLAPAGRPDKFEFSHARILEQTDVKLKIARHLLGTDIVVEQTWQIDPESYSLDYTLGFRNLSDKAVAIPELMLNAGYMGPLHTPRGFMGAGGIDQAVQFLERGSSKSDTEQVRSVFGADDDDTKEWAATPVQWVAIQNKYFVALLSNQKAMPGMIFKVPPIDPAKADKKDPRHLAGYVRLETEPLAGNGLQTHEFNFYLGPKIYRELAALGNNQEQVMQYDRFMLWRFVPMNVVMKSISLGIFWLITTLGGVIGNYGLAIILTTIVIRTMFWPVTHRSTVWSQRMKELQPEMAKLKETYGNDPQLMNQKTMELYKKHKISPFGGCLPMFFQIPVFFALFNVIRSSIALRHEGFLWISDLSMPDTLVIIPIFGGMALNILPFAMGGAMMLQQKLMPTSADSSQQKMMLFMSVFFVYICYSMPAGLTLYWTISNCYSIVQSQMIHRMLKRKNEAETGTTNDKKKNEKKNKKNKKKTKD